jgi:hypothetical protein
MVARWNIFKPKISILVNFGGPWNGKVWPFGIYVFQQFGTIYGHLVHFMAIV